VRAAVSGNLILVVIEALLSMAGFAIFGLVSPVLLGICFGITSLVPVIGSSIVWVPVVLFEFLQGNFVAGFGIILWSGCQIALCDYYLGPHLIERRAKLHPFVVLLGILGGVAQFGVLGIILGPTIMAVAMVGMEIARRTWTVRPD
jgi:predicted PurR-regulated permease PerM